MMLSKMKAASVLRRASSLACLSAIGPCEQVQHGVFTFVASDRTWPGCTNRKVYIPTFQHTRSPKHFVVQGLSLSLSLSLSHVHTHTHACKAQTQPVPHEFRPCLRSIHAGKVTHRSRPQNRMVEAHLRCESGRE